MQEIIKVALKYFGVFILLYGALTLLSFIPAVGSFSNQVYRSASQPVLQALLPKAFIQLKKQDDRADLIRVEFASKEKVQQQLQEAKRTGKKSAPIQGKSFEFGFYKLFFSFFLFYVALILLSPLNIKEKIAGLFLGTFIYYLYTVLKMCLALFSHFNEPEIGVYESSEWAVKTANAILYFMSLGVNVLVVLTLWAAFTFKKNNWKRLLAEGANILNVKNKK